jgi:hypothetical protein
MARVGGGSHRRHKDNLDHCPRPPASLPLAARCCGGVCGGPASGGGLNVCAAETRRRETALDTSPNASPHADAEPHLLPHGPCCMSCWDTGGWSVEQHAVSAQRGRTIGGPNWPQLEHRHWQHWQLKGAAATLACLQLRPRAAPQALTRDVDRATGGHGQCDQASAGRPSLAGASPKPHGGGPAGSDAPHCGSPGPAAPLVARVAHGPRPTGKLSPGPMRQRPALP